MKISLREVDGSNWRQVIKLKVAPGQEEFVATNVYSIAESKINPEWNTRAIYADETLVGFTMYGLSVEEGSEFNGYWICRLMVDQQYQKKGYGRAAMKLILASICEAGFSGPVYISFEPGNTVAEKLYQSLGFEDTGRIEGGEKVYCLTGCAEYREQ